ncbi:hypothetical protein AB1Y20_002697 [Prymnesium parvum]|uniref:TFIIS central domain-containing protein n=1 Tax=Prymnesium parvum TaxID=97485 RepID=A0AB34JA82_PRYPA
MGERAEAMEAALLRALEEANPAAEEYPRAFLLELARMIRESLATRARADGLASLVRSLCFNLKSNPQLAAAVCAERLSPQALCAMDAAEWAPEELRRERAAAAARGLRLRLREELSGAALSRTVRCESCGAREARFVHVGAQRDVSGKCETWGCKDKEVWSTLVQCCACGHSWHTDSVPLAATEKREETREARGEGREAGGTDSVPLAATEKREEAREARGEGREAGGTKAEEGGAAGKRGEVAAGERGVWRDRLQLRAELRDALLAAAGGDAAHDAFLGSSAAAIAVKAEAAWRESEESLGAHQRKLRAAAAAIGPHVLEQLVIGSLQPEQLATAALAPASRGERPAKQPRASYSTSSS